MRSKSRKAKTAKGYRDRLDMDFDLPQERERSKFLTVEITLPRDVAEEALETLEGRGSSLDHFVGLKLLAFTKSNTIMGLQDRMNFGKYTGAFVEAVVRADLSYMAWATKKATCSTRFAPEVVSLVDNLLADEGLTVDRYMGNWDGQQ